MRHGDTPTVSAVDVTVYDVPTDRPEADGTLSWDRTTVVAVQVRAGGVVGLGWTYASSACREIVERQLTPALVGTDVLAVPAAHETMVRACRNLGRPGTVSCAVSAVDIALWDAKAKLLETPLADLFGRCIDAVAIYGSGGFTTYDDCVATAQLEHWIGELGIPRVKIKVGESWGTAEERDLQRAIHARRVIGPGTELYVDANGGYGVKRAVAMGRRYAEAAGVSWFEEPVSSDDLEGLRLVREALDLEVAAGEYGFDEPYFERMLGAGAVDCLQIDVTRCGGYTSWLRAAALAHARGVDVSGHCAPNLHAHVASSISNLRHVEFFWDHERIESLLFDGVLSPCGGALVPSADAPGHGMTLRASDAAAYRI